MRIYQVESSNIKTVAYDSHKMALVIEFQGGAIYCYDEVTPDEVGELMFAESIGQYFNKNIARNFNYTRIN